MSWPAVLEPKRVLFVFEGSRPVARDAFASAAARLVVGRLHEVADVRSACSDSAACRELARDVLAACTGMTIAQPVVLPESCDMAHLLASLSSARAIVVFCPRTTRLADQVSELPPVADAAELSLAPDACATLMPLILDVAEAVPSTPTSSLEDLATLLSAQIRGSNWLQENPPRGESIFVLARRLAQEKEAAAAGAAASAAPAAASDAAVSL